MLTEFHANQGSLLHQQQHAHAELTTKLDRLSHQIATIHLWDDDDITWEGTHLSAAVLPLLLAQPFLAQAIRMLKGGKTLALAPAKARWLRKQFNNLLAYCIATRKLRPLCFANHTEHVSSRIMAMVSRNPWLPLAAPYQ